MEGQIPIETIPRDVRGTRHPWRVRVDRKLTKRQEDRLRLILYWLDDMTVEEKEELIDGKEQVWHSYNHEIAIVRLARAKGDLPMTFSRLDESEDPITIPEENNGTQEERSARHGHH